MPTDRLVGVDHTNPRLPQSVIDASKGTTAADVAAGDTLAQAKAYADSVAGGGGGGGVSAATVTTMTSSLNPSVLNQNVTFTATVTGGGLPVNIGTVSFLRDGVAFITLPINNAGQASTTIATLVGTPAITARYNANAILATSTSPPLTQTVVSPPVTTTTLVSSVNPADSGTSVTFTATTTSGGVPVTVGTMSFKRGANNMAVGVPVNGSGVATFTTTAIPVGSWQITAVYDGLQSFQASTSTAVSQAVIFAGGPVPVTVTLTSDDASSGLGQLVMLTATVRVTATGVAVNSGTITFKDGGSTIGTSAVPVNPTTGAATYVSSTLTSGTHTMTADYVGAPVYTNATSNTISQIVSAGGGSAVTAQTLVASKPTARLGEVVTLRTQIVSGINTRVTTGTVTFKDGATTLGVGTPLNLYGESSLTLTSLGLGTHSITAEYVGAPAFENDISGAVTVTVVSTLPTPTEPTWAGAFNSGSLKVITDWYHYNTGHLSDGWDPAGLWNPAGPGSIANVNVTAGWLTANAAAGKVVNDGGGHWTVTGLHASQILVSTSHVTFNHCYVDRQDFASVWGNAVPVYDPSITSDEFVTNVDIVFNRCTFATDGTGGEGTYGDVAGFFPVTSVGYDAYVFNYCEATQWAAAFKIYRGTSVNYCWVHDLDLFGFDPHNTSASIRGNKCRLNRNLFTDGTSSDISLYADLEPYTDFFLTENVCWVKPDHADGEVNFPARSTGLSPLSPGYVRELVGNKLERGASGDNNYFSKVSGNTLITGEPLFGGADTVQVAGVPTVLAGTGGLGQTLTSLHYTPTASSTQLYFHGLGRAGHVQDPNLVFTDESGSGWLLVPGCETPVESAPANTAQYGLSASLWKQETSSASQAFRRVIVDPYLTSSIGYQYGLIIELTGIVGLTLAQPAVLSAVGAEQPWGAILPSITSGTLAVNATSGNLVMLFITTVHEEIGRITPPSGWNVLGNPSEPRVSGTCFWRTNFTGRSVTVPDLSDSAGVAVTILCEFDV